MIPILPKYGSSPDSRHFQGAILLINSNRIINTSETQTNLLIDSMKRIFKTTSLTIALLVITMLCWSQEPPHPNTGQLANQGGMVNGPVGGGAPIGGGMSILITLGISLGMRRLMKLRESSNDCT
jgi:hypothetical protein